MAAEINGHHFEDDILKSIFLHDSFCILITISLEFDPGAQFTLNQY